MSNDAMLKRAKEVVVFYKGLKMEWDKTIKKESLNSLINFSIIDNI